MRPPGSCEPSAQIQARFWPSFPVLRFPAGQSPVPGLQLLAQRGLQLQQAEVAGSCAGPGTEAQAVHNRQQLGRVQLGDLEGRVHLLAGPLHRCAGGAAAPRGRGGAGLMRENRAPRATRTLRRGQNRGRDFQKCAKAAAGVFPGRSVPRERPGGGVRRSSLRGPRGGRSPHAQPALREESHAAAGRPLRNLVGAALPPRRAPRGTLAHPFRCPTSRFPPAPPFPRLQNCLFLRQGRALC